MFQLNGRLGVKKLNTSVYIGPAEFTTEHYRLDILEHRLDCVPSGAESTVQTVYRNNVPFFNVSMTLPLSIDSIP
ncbi:hypothetical protein BDV36DRAFT_260139 [Aspergillus pseudocaelatus]|uniref:Uncharacterized protein n=1 Tax=Aspergillus pseudocaelatus TaxID=1825620 RepID=A0ABQ6WH89_9EURO|nr:hypothetical protein BDV36DRAFT_260139 [Aspergillus pseudocaelatus]